MGPADLRVMGGRGRRGGYVAVDALLALMVLSSTLSCALAVAHQGGMASRAASELYRAKDLTAYLIETSPTAAGVTAGVFDGIAWRRTISEPTIAVGGEAICVRLVELHARESGRDYSVRSSAICRKDDTP
jgi:hypothetical protein